MVKLNGMQRLLRIQFSRSVTQQYLEDSLRVRSHCGMQRRPAGQVLHVGVRAGVQKAFGRVCSRVPRR